MFSNQIFNVSSCIVTMSPSDIPREDKVIKKSFERLIGPVREVLSYHILLTGGMLVHIDFHFNITRV